MKWNSRAEYIEITPENPEDAKHLLAFAEKLPREAEKCFDDGEKEINYNEDGTLRNLSLYR